MENRMKTTLSLAAAAALTGSAAAVPITLTNTDFTGDATNSNPSGWVTTETFSPGGISVQPAGGGVAALGQVLTFQDRDGVHNVTQAISTSEATADSFGTWTVTFGDSGWRNYQTTNGFTGFTVSLIDVDNGNAVLASDSVVLPAASSTGSNIWQDLGAQVFNLSYDNTAVGLSGNQVAIVIESDATGSSFNPTAYIDNITVDAVPEPGSLALLGLGGLLIAQRRRRGD